MSKRFIIECSVLTGISVVLILLLNAVPALATSQDLSWSSLIFFLILTVLIYVLGIRAARSSNPNGLTQLILAVVMIKLVSCAGIIIAYQELANPSSNLFVVPFLALYLIFTVYEVIVLNRLNRIEVTATD